VTALSPGSERTARAEPLAADVVVVGRLLWLTVGAEKPAAAGAAFEKLRPRQVELLRLLARQPGLSVRTAAETLSMRPHNLSTLLAALIDSGLVERRGDPADRRIGRLFLSGGARAEVEAAERTVHTAVVEALARLTDVDQGRIRSALPALHRLISGLDSDRERARGG
jgi:DNA-binding MarR family transcriptional regulator